MSVPMSPAHAAQVAKVSRRTIMRAVESREIQATRNNKNQWQITEEALKIWMGAQWAPITNAHQESPTTPTSENVELTAKLAAAETRAELLSTQLDDVKAERDQWRKMAQKLADRPNSFWPWRRKTDS